MIITRTATRLPESNERNLTAGSMAACRCRAFIVATAVLGLIFPSFASAAEPTHADIAYARVGDHQLKLDIYPAQSQVAQAPVIIWAHGGAWRRGSRQSVPITPLTEHGFAIASVDYRLSPVARFPAQIHDIKAAIRFLRANAEQYGFDPQRFVVAGASAGGHLAALVGVSNGVAALEGNVGDHLGTSSDVQGALSFYGASNLQSILSQSTPHGLSVRVPALKLLLGGTPDVQPKIARLASPTAHVDPSDPPLWLVHGDADPQMPIEQSVELAEAYRAADLPVDFETIAGAVHGGAEFYASERLSRLAGAIHRSLNDTSNDPVQPSATRSLKGRPNILFCVADDWGWPHAGVYGAGEWVQTPNFDRVAREGVLFENAFTSNPKCCPSRASMVAGRNTWQMKEAVNHIVPWPEEFISYVDLLDQAGYHVGLTGKGWGPGTWQDSGREYNPAGPSYDQYKTDPPHRGMSRNDYARNFIDGFLADRPSKETPFCFWLGTSEPHRGYDEGAGLRAGKNAGEVELPQYFPDERDIRNDMLDYAVEVEYFDEHVGRVLAHLEEIGELENTIVVITSDHGMPFPRVKGQIYEDGFHLPLAIRWGEASGGRTVKDFVNVRDFAPTFIEAAGLPPHDQFTGRSLVSLLTSDKSGWVEPRSQSVMLVGKERHDLGRPNDWGYPVRAIRTPEFLYVHNYEPDRWPAGNPETGYRNCDGGPTKSRLLNSFDRWYALSFGKRPEHELYRVSEDPDCIHNLANNEDFAETMAELRDRMESLLRAEGDLRALGRPEWFDTIEYTASRKHAYDTWLNNRALAD